jgi:hypothetical protein
MRTNGDRRGRKAGLRLELALELRLIDDARHTPVRTRAEALAWLRRWRRRPKRVFWEVQPTGGQRLI